MHNNTTHTLAIGLTLAVGRALAVGLALAVGRALAELGTQSPEIIADKRADQEDRGMRGAYV